MSPATASGGPVRQALGLAVFLGSALSLAIAGYLLHARILPRLAASPLGSDLLWAHALTAVAGVGLATGAALIWSARGRGVRPDRAPEPPVESAPRSAGPGAGPPPLLGAFSRIVSTIERQAGNLDDLAVRLDRTRREVESTRARLQDFSFRDEVTRTYNRRFFSMRLDEEIARYRRFGHPVAVVLLDVDDLKTINDELGHAAGDATLRAVAELLLQSSRGINVICRYGGDEFAVLLVETAKAGARLYAERLRAALAALLVPIAHGRRVTASFGLAALPEDGAMTADDLVRLADEALYAAKRSGKNRAAEAGRAMAGTSPGQREGSA